MFIFVWLVVYYSFVWYICNLFEIVDKIILRIFEKGNICCLFFMYGVYCYFQLLIQFFGFKIMFKLFGWLCYIKLFSYYYFVK